MRGFLFLIGLAGTIVFFSVNGEVSHRWTRTITVWNVGLQTSPWLRFEKEETRNEQAVGKAVQVLYNYRSDGKVELVSWSTLIGLGAVAAFVAYWRSRPLQKQPAPPLTDQQAPS
jgi:hypothetical protein